MDRGQSVPAHRPFLISPRWQYKPMAVSSPQSSVPRNPIFAKETLIMLGAIHRDENGPELLDKWLDVIRPQVITLEFSQYGMAFRKERGAFYRQRVEEVYNKLKKNNRPCYDNALSALLSYVEMPYEFERASHYAESCGTPLYLIDMDFFSYLRLREIDRLLSEANIEIFLSGTHEDRSGYEEVMANLFFEKGVMGTIYGDEMWARDKYMSSKLRVLRKYYGNRRLLHITGWQHLQDPYRLYETLKPIKVFSHDKTLRI
jgi:hypothetical protein